MLPIALGVLLWGKKRHANWSHSLLCPLLVVLAVSDKAKARRCELSDHTNLTGHEDPAQGECTSGTVCLAARSPHLTLTITHLNIGTVCGWSEEALTCAGCWFTLQWQCLKTLLIHLQLQVGQVLLHFPSHLGIFIQLFGIEEGTTAYPLFMPACLSNIQHCGICTALTQGPGRRKTSLPLTLWSTYRLISQNCQTWGKTLCLKGPMPHSSKWPRGNPE